MFANNGHWKFQFMPPHKWYEQVLASKGTIFQVGLQSKLGNHFSSGFTMLRMRNWCELVKVAVAAEVPNYEVMTSLAVFLDDLTNDELGDDVVRRIAAFFKFCPVFWFHQIRFYLFPLFEFLWMDQACFTFRWPSHCPRMSWSFSWPASSRWPWGSSAWRSSSL